MNRYQAILVVGILAGLLLTAGCTDQGAVKKEQIQPSTPAPTPVKTESPTPSTPEPTQKASPSLFDGKVTEPPAELAVSVSAQKDPVYSNITITFDGGKGQDLIQLIQVRTTLETGEVIEQQLGKKKGDEIAITGTRGLDRVQVMVSYMNGNSYLVMDRVVGQDRAGLEMPTQVQESAINASQEGLYPGPVTQPPNSLSVSVDVSKEPIYRVITGTFRGGHGQSLVSKIEMRAVLGTGESVINQISNNIGATGEMQGSDGIDHVQVIVSFKNGETYKILEKTLGPRG
ncbi:MAG: hypothetical protein LUQ50_00540 [Methanospirillum sp.]|uniref:hypothetical protein n=1 Tax=Methanospirillum sp. TaxID=45200 RepID=UPI002374ED22|nr:hypothetical protein [Methanospirillum sp.]MDD1727539.1 hypothetical protein [Methanospirillum sp.]